MKSLLKGRKGKSGSRDDDDLSPTFEESEGEEEVLSMPKKKVGGKKGGKKKSSSDALASGTSPVALLGRVPGLSRLPFVQAAMAPPAPVRDPFDNPALMARIASEVAALPMPEIVASDDEELEEEVVRPVIRPPEAEVAAPMREMEEDRRPGFAMPDPMKESLGHSGDISFEQGEEPFPEDGEEDEMKSKAAGNGKKVALAAAAVVALSAAGAGAWWWMSHGSAGGDESSSASDRKGSAGKARVAAPGNQPQSGATISMALPPPPVMTAETAAPATDEKSSSRRPWLTGGADAPAAGNSSAGGDIPSSAMTPPPVPAVAASAGELADHPAAAADKGKADDKGKMAGGAIPAAPVSPEPAPAVVPGPEPAAHAPVAASGSSSVSKDGKQPLSRSAMAAPLPEFTDIRAPAAASGEPPSFEKLPKIAPPAPPLAVAPLNELQKRTASGVLPVRSADGKTPWQTYARPFNAPAKNSRVAVVVVGLGMNPVATQTAITSLPAEISLSFSPYAPNLARQMDAARAQGHEVLLDMPMEPANFPEVDPGPLALMSGLSATDNTLRYETVLGKGAGYVGIVSHDGGKFEASASGMKAVMSDLQERGLLLVASQAARGTAANADIAVPIADSLMMIDERPFREAIDRRLDYAVTVAKARGVAVVLAQPFPVSYQRLTQWAGGLAAKGVSLAPVSSAVTVP